MNWYNFLLLSFLFPVLALWEDLLSYAYKCCASVATVACINVGGRSAWPFLPKFLGFIHLQYWFHTSKNCSGELHSESKYISNYFTRCVCHLTIWDLLGLTWETKEAVFFFFPSYHRSFLLCSLSRRQCRCSCFLMQSVLPCICARFWSERKSRTQHFKVNIRVTQVGWEGLCTQFVDSKLKPLSGAGIGLQETSAWALFSNPFQF